MTIPARSGFKYPTRTFLCIAALSVALAVLPSCGGGGGGTPDSSSAGVGGNSSSTPGGGSGGAPTAANGAPAVTTQPQATSVAADSAATFTVRATGTAPLSYQWRRDGMAIQGATSASYTSPEVAATDSGASFDVVVTNSAGSATSQAAALTVTLHVGANRYVGQKLTTGTTDGDASSALFNAPSGLVVDAQGNIFVADTGNYTVRKIDTSNRVSTFAGQPGVSGFADGPGKNAKFGGIATTCCVGLVPSGSTSPPLIQDQVPSGPRKLVLDSAQNIVLPDRAHNVIRRIAPDGTVSTIIGQPDAPGLVAGQGDTVRLNSLGTVTIDASSNAVAFSDGDIGNEGIRRATLTPTASVGPVIGATGGLIGDIASDNAGSTYFLVGNTVEVLAPDNSIRLLAGGNPIQGIGAPGADGSGASAGFANPQFIIRNSDSSFYVYDIWSSRLRQVTPSGAVTTVLDLTNTLGSDVNVRGMVRYRDDKTLLMSAFNAVYLIVIPN